MQARKRKSSDYDKDNNEVYQINSDLPLNLTQNHNKLLCKELSNRRQQQYKSNASKHVRNKEKERHARRINSNKTRYTRTVLNTYRKQRRSINSHRIHMVRETWYTK